MEAFRNAVVAPIKRFAQVELNGGHEQPED
jgi:hypothetical protein